MVIGSGPAGIAAVGRILDAGVAPHEIAWVDNDFKVGDFGRHWQKVTSNTPVSMFLKFYNALESFGFQDKDSTFMIERLNPDKKCPLGLASEPLQWITNHLLSKVTPYIGKARQVAYKKRGIEVILGNASSLSTEKLVLAIGAEPKTLQFSNIKKIPLTVAANPAALKQEISHHDVVAVFGSYQSARTVAENVANTSAKKIIHFYRSHRSFKAHVESIGLSTLAEAIQINPENLLRHLPQCNKVIYAVGFERRQLHISGLADDYGYNPDDGKIAPGIYGLGIAFPEIIPHTLGREKYKVNALYPIMTHLLNIFPMWTNEPVPQIELDGKSHNSSYEEKLLVLSKIF